MSTSTTTGDLDTQIAALKTRLDAAQRARLRAEGERDAAAATAEQARTQLSDEFGVTTVADATTMLAGLDSDLATAIEQITTTLDQAGL